MGTLAQRRRCFKRARVNASFELQAVQVGVGAVGRQQRACIPHSARRPWSTHGDVVGMLDGLQAVRE